MTAPDASPQQRQYHPTFLHARREFLMILAVWAVCLIWAVPYCYLTGYIGPGEQISQVPTVWGIPRWVFFGIAVPWLLADVFATWFCFGYMQDDDLGEAHEGADVHEDIDEAHAAGGGEGEA